MLTLTDKAAKKVKQVIAAQLNPKSVGGIRISVVDGSCSGFQYALKLEHEASEDDQVIRIDGFTIFADKESLLFLKGTEIDYVETLQGAGFKFSNPNAKSTCSCGDSFQV